MIKIIAKKIVDKRSPETLMTDVGMPSLPRRVMTSTNCLWSFKSLIKLEANCGALSATICNSRALIELSSKIGSLSADFNSIRVRSSSSLRMSCQSTPYFSRSPMRILKDNVSDYFLFGLCRQS